MYILESFAGYFFCVIVSSIGSRAERELYSFEPKRESARSHVEGSSKSVKYVHVHGALCEKRESQEEGDKNVRNISGDLLLFKG